MVMVARELKASAFAIPLVVAIGGALIVEAVASLCLCYFLCFHVCGLVGFWMLDL